jgi:hypothetical protein
MLTLQQIKSISFKWQSVLIKTVAVMVTVFLWLVLWHVLIV